MTKITRTRRLRRVTALLAAAALVGIAGASVAAPNLIANGDLELPRQQAKPRIDPTESEVVFEIPGPDGFGRVVIRSTNNGRRIAEKARVGYGQIPGSARGLYIDTKDLDINGQWETSIWFDLKGQIRPNRQYAYALELRLAAENSLPPVEMIVPAIWADGKFMGSSIKLEWKSEIKTYDDLFKRGVVKTPDFRNQTGGQSVVLRLPRSFKSRFFIDRISFRELDEAALKGEAARMPMPVRYMAVDDILEEEIEDAIARTPESLKAAQNPEGYWAGSGLADSVAVTATIMDSLAGLGEDMTTKEMQKGIKWLETQEVTETAALSARLGFFTRRGLLENRKRVAADLNRLVAAQREDGGWSASAADDAAKDRKLKSTVPTTFNACLQLLSAQYAGFKIEVGMWRKAAAFFRDAQARDGGFRSLLEKDGGLSEATASHNTAFGLAGLLLTLDMGFANGARGCDQYLASSEHIDALNRAIDKWLNEYYDEYFKKISTLGTQPDVLANATGMAHVMRFSGISRLHDKDVFRTEATNLLRSYSADSAVFGGSLVQSAESLATLDVSSAPVLFQRIVLGASEGHRFSRDAEHLTRYIGNQRKRPINWVEADIDQPIRELVAVPVLYLHAAGEVDLSKDEWKKLRQYVFAGGTIVANIAENNAPGRAALLAGITDAFPEFKIADLADSDSVMTSPNKLAAMTGMKVVSNGLKDLIFITPEDWSCRLNNYQLEQYPDTFKFFENLVEYTTDSEAPRSRFMESTWSLPAANLWKQKVARIEVGADAPVLPDLLDTYDRVIQNEYRVKLDAAPPGDLKDTTLLWVSGAGGKPLTPEHKKALQDAMAGNTLIFAEVLGGNATWAEALRSELLKLAPDVRIRTLPSNHPVYTGLFPETFGYDLRTVPLRKALREEFKKRPRLVIEVIEKGDKEVGLFTRYDLGSGLGYLLYPGCKGVMPEQSRQFSANLLLYAMQRRLPAL
jgi:hypothetical protein